MLFLLKIVSDFSSVILTFLLLSVGIYLTIKTRLFQIKALYLSVKTVIESIRKKDNDTITSMLLALGGTVGVGNIAGVGAAIAIGGPGSVFWIWICGIIGMITKYAEVFLAVKFKPLGPFEYIKNTFGKFGNIVKLIFGLSCILSSVLIGNVIQSKAVIDTLCLTFKFDYTVSAVFIGIPVFILVFSSGNFIKRTSSIAVPIVSILYIFMTFFIIINNIEYLPIVIKNIFLSAFNIKSESAGIFGFLISQTIRQGISKGLFSHEAGQGSSPIAYSAEETANSRKASLLGVLEVFIDTGIISTLTAFAMLTSGFWSENGMKSAAEMFIKYFGNVGGVLFAVAIYLFCIAAISGWIFYAKRSINILTNKKIVSYIYSTISILIIPLVALFPINVLWQLSDIFMLMMSLPNLISIIHYKNVIFYSLRMCKNV